MAAAVQRLGSPTDKLARGRTKSEATCKFARQGKNCPEIGQGCPYSHKKPKAPAAPAQPGAGGDNRSVGRKSDRNGKNNRSASRGSRGKDRPRSSTPSNKFDNSNATQSRTRTLSEGSKERQSKQRRGLTDAENIKRDKFEEAQLKAGKSLGYQRTARQADSAAANAAEAIPANAPRSRDSSKGRGAKTE
eukprot:6944083-Pyramimonas_sp.AAC.1